MLSHINNGCDLATLNAVVRDKFSTYYRYRTNESNEQEIVNQRPVAMVGSSGSEEHLCGKMCKMIIEQPLKNEERMC
ncbi:hypothetical protein THOM_2840 [Trachipleistophora hominis]|uniref:Uncharacterized protein n=1 Tax=Trachipleistophora hominis TaxID=72359 RepID=L7JRZ0_TRAHO|nr:hypothetical protein THOM_2840 [Trachipleistophora hominis]